MNPSTSVIATRDIDVPMRDGTILKADLFLPASGGPWPVIIQRTPYNKSSQLPVATTLDPLRAALNGFAVLYQDVRGRYKSAGEFYPYRDDQADGYDTVEWAAVQPWSTGRVGVCGRSYAGATTWQAAIANPPHLGAIALVLGTGDVLEGWTYRQGAFEYAFIMGWPLGDLGADLLFKGQISHDEFCTFSDRLTEWLTTPNANPWDVICPRFPYIRDWLDHPYDESYWGPLTVSTRLHKDIAPSLSIGGWYDMFPWGTVDLFNRLQALDCDPDRHALVMGPWMHAGPPSPMIGDVHFGLRASLEGFDVQGAVLNWFRRWLIGPEHARPQPRVQTFTMGVNRWLSGERWPLGTGSQSLYLTSTDGANGLDGDGRLVPSVPAPGADSTIYNAGQPVPTLGGGMSPRPIYRPGAFDQRPVERRPDVLVYTSDPLDRPLTINGSVTATIYAAAAEGELDLAVKLVDVAPNGFAMNLTDGIARSQHLAPQADRKDDFIAYTVEVGPTANVFAAGHRIRVDVAHSSYPRFDLNSQARDGTKHTVGHGGRHASSITLPVMAGD